MNFDKHKTLEFTSKLSNFEIVNSEFIRCKCYMLATGDNYNGSDITMESVKKAIDRGEFYNKPVIAHLYKDEDNGKWRVGGHDSKWIITNTSIEFVNECIPFGTIPESSDLKLEEVLEADGQTKNTYLTCQLILWTGRFNIMDAAYSEDIYFNQSCELSINEWHYKENHILAIDDFTFSALCLLNKSDDKEKNVRPCFPSCRVEKIKDFSINSEKFKYNFGLMMESLKKYNLSGTDASTKKKGEPKMDLTKFVESLSSKKCTNNDKVPKYALLNVNDSKAFVLDIEDYKPYSLDYAVAKEDETGKEYLVIDFDSKAEMSLSATEKIKDENFKEFSIYDEIQNSIKKFEEAHEKETEERINKATEDISLDFQKKYDELKNAYDAIAKANEILQSKVDKFEKKELEAATEQHKKDIDSIVEGYTPRLGRYSAFLVYKANIDKHYSKTCEQVEQDMILMAGKFLTSKENSSSAKFSYTPHEAGTGYANRTNEAITSRYGHLLDKYIK